MLLVPIVYSILSIGVAISLLTVQGSMKILKSYVTDIGVNLAFVWSVGTNISLLIVTTCSPIRERSPVLGIVKSAVLGLCVTHVGKLTNVTVSG